MNILMLTDGITPFVQGGIQRHSQLVVEYLARLGNQITVYHYLENSTAKEVKIGEVFSLRALQNITLVTFEYNDISKLPGHYLRAQRAISHKYFEHLKISRRTYDFIYCKGFMGWALLNNRHSLSFSAPISVKFHGMNMFQSQPNCWGYLQSHMLKTPVRSILRKSDYVFSYGGKITSIIESQCQTPVLEVQAGIDESWVLDQPPERAGLIKFLFVGRYDRVKGLPELYEALERIAKLRDDWECHFVGPIPDEQQLKIPQCYFHNAVYDSELLKSHYDHSDVLLNTSISEGMPNVVLEAMSRGLSVLATDVGATSVLVHQDVNGRLIAKPDVGLMTTALMEILNEGREALKAHQSASIKRVQSMTWSELSIKLESIIKSCIKQ